ncbi:hypothetical protein HanRHA438_Chr00c01g0842281 [Helianthus annuus]|nr:hypothetical protein HanRHA438_Chr00c01g0842281 [Helianthus annuus]
MANEDKAFTSTFMTRLRPSLDLPHKTTKNHEAFSDNFPLHSSDPDILSTEGYRR